MTKREHHASRVIAGEAERQGLIQLRWVSSPSSLGRTFKYKSLRAAQTKAHKLVTAHPKRDHDDYAVHPQTGNCLFYQGTTFEALFPAAEPQAGVLQSGEP